MLSRSCKKYVFTRFVINFGAQKAPQTAACQKAAKTSSHGFRHSTSVFSRDDFPKGCMSDGGTHGSVPFVNHRPPNRDQEERRKRTGVGFWLSPSFWNSEDLLGSTIPVSVIRFVSLRTARTLQVDMFSPRNK